MQEYGDAIYIRLSDGRKIDVDIESIVQQESRRGYDDI